MLYKMAIPLVMAQIFIYLLLKEYLLAQFLVIAISLTLLMYVITRKWKISFHVCVQGYFAMLLIGLSTTGALFLINIPIIAWARVKGRYHTKMQVVAGGLLGLLMGFATIYFLGKSNG